MAIFPNGLDKIINKTNDLLRRLYKVEIIDNIDKVFLNPVLDLVCQERRDAVRIQEVIAGRKCCRHNCWAEIRENFSQSCNEMGQEPPRISIKRI